MSQNVLVVHGGGPTAVINASLYGVIEEAKRNPEVGKVYGAIGGTGAIFSETFIDLTSFDDEKLKLLLHTPASAIGSSRYPLYEKDYEKMVDIFKKHDIKYVLLNGGSKISSHSCMYYGSHGKKCRMDHSSFRTCKKETGRCSSPDLSAGTKL